MFSVPTEDELNELLNRTSTHKFRRGFITVNGYLLPELFSSMEKDIREFEIFNTDIWICGYPKTGTTCVSEIAWLIANDFDYKGAQVDGYYRTRLLEVSMNYDTTVELGKKLAGPNSIEYAKTHKHPRTLKSHLPFPLLPQQIVNAEKNPKIIYIARNPMDTCIADYHQSKNVQQFTGTFEEFCKLFLFDKVNCGPYPAHVLSFWQQGDKPNVLFLTYEEMKRDLEAVIGKVAKFLGKTVSEKDSKRLQEHVSFDSIKNNLEVDNEDVLKEIEAKEGAKVSRFITEGINGDYKDFMSPETIEQFNYWMKKKFEGSGLNLLDV